MEKNATNSGHRNAINDDFTKYTLEGFHFIIKKTY